MILTKYSVDLDFNVGLAAQWCVDSADMQARATEFRDLFETPQKRDDLPEPLDCQIVPESYVRARKMFLNRFHYLTDGRFESE